MAYYRIVDPSIINRVEDWYNRRDAARDAFLKLSRRVGASRNRFASASVFGRRVFSFVFNKPPDAKHWKTDRSGDFWLPKLSTKEGKKIAREVDAIQKGDADREELSRMFKLKGAPLKFFGIEKIGKVLILNVGDEWEFSHNGLERISDVAVEALRNTRRKSNV